MLEVDIDKILPLTEARDNFNKMVDEVEGSDHMYVLTKNGKPSAVVVGVNHLEKLTGKSQADLTSMVEKKADTTPVVEEVPKSAPVPPTSPPVAENTAPKTKTPATPAPAASQAAAPTETQTLTTPPATPSENDDLFV